MIYMVFAIYLLFIQNIFGQRCSGPLKCCRGFKWDKQRAECIPCKYPYYGRGCRFNCNCFESVWNQFEGNVSYTSSIGPSSVPEEDSMETRENISYISSVDATKQLNFKETTKSGSTTFVTETFRIPNITFVSNKSVFLIFISLSIVALVFLAVYITLRIREKIKGPSQSRSSNENEDRLHYEEVDMHAMTQIAA